MAIEELDINTFKQKIKKDKSNNNCTVLELEISYNDYDNNPQVYLTTLVADKELSKKPKKEKEDFIKERVLKPYIKIMKWDKEDSLKEAQV